MEIFFLASNNAEMYIELEFGPYGHYLGLLLHGRRNCLIHSFPITYNAKIGMYRIVSYYYGSISFQVLNKGHSHWRGLKRSCNKTIFNLVQLNYFLNMPCS